MSINFQKHRIVFIVVSLFVAFGAMLLPFVSTSCGAQRARADEAALARLRAMTRGGLLPAENVVAAVESEYKDTKAGALARLLRARVKMQAGDYAGAAAVLDTAALRDRTALGDYVLFMRAEALEKAGRRVEARATYEQLAREFPSSLRAREATLRAAEMTLQDGQAAAVPVFMKALGEANDGAALLLAAKAYEQQGEGVRALGAYRRIYFSAPASPESAEAEAALTRLNSTTAPATAEEALGRANKLYEAKRYAEAAEAYTDAFGRFPNAASAPAQLRRGISAYQARRTADAISALNVVPVSAGDVRAEALHYLAQTYARSRQWNMVRSTVEEMRRVFPQSVWTMRALVAAGQAAKEDKNGLDASYFFRTAMNSFPGRAEVTPAQFEIAWLAHEAKNYQESSRLLIEHLALYADKNTDFRGRAGYWAARDAERAGRLAEARALYRAMLARYDANWYGYLSKQRLDVLDRAGGGNVPEVNFAPDSLVGRAIANLRPVTVAEETAGPSEDERIAKAEQLVDIGLDQWAHDELDKALAVAPASPRLNLAKARVFRASGDNLQAFNALRRSYPDYAQMKPEELAREEWEVFYPLAHWDIIVQEARAKNLDPYMVAGLIRQESVFNPRAVSPARAYGLMQLLVPTGRLIAQRYGVERSVTVESLFEPRLNIQLGTGYLRDNLDKFGRIEYVAAAYNAGPGRAVQWRATLPLEIDEWAEAIPFRETRGYVQGVVRNMLQYRRLYDDQGRFRSEVGTRAVRPTATTEGSPAPGQTPNADVRPRRMTGNEEKEE